MKTVKWGVIGTGDVMEIKSGPGLYKAEGSSLYGVYNRNLDKARNYAKQHGVPTVFREADELIHSSNVDVVYIATPPVSHFDYAIRTLQAGKILYIEKPITMNYQQALDIQMLAREKQRPVYAAFYRRGLEKFIEIKRQLECGAIGAVRYVNVVQTAPLADAFSNPVNIPWRVQPEVSGGGLFMDVGTHVLDTLMLFFGEYEWLSGKALNQGAYYSAEDTVCASFQFKNGVVGTGQWCFVANETVNKVEIVGDKGRICYDAMAADHFSLISQGNEKEFQFTVPEHIAMPYQQAVVNELLGKSVSFANFDHAVNLMQMIDQLLTPYYQKG